jgi:hypothetical protein
MSEMYIIKVLCVTQVNVTVIKTNGLTEFCLVIAKNFVENPSNFDLMRQLFLMFSGVLV